MDNISLDNFLFRLENLLFVLAPIFNMTVPLVAVWVTLNIYAFFEVLFIAAQRKSGDYNQPDEGYIFK